MKQHPRRRSKRRTPAPTLHDLLRQRFLPSAGFGDPLRAHCYRWLPPGAGFCPTEDHAGCGQHGYYILWHCAANRIAERQTADGCRAGGPH